MCRGVPALLWWNFWWNQDSRDRGKACVRNGLERHFWRKFWWAQKRPLRCPHPRGLHAPSFDAPSPSSWFSPVRSGRTVRRGGEDRSGFGCCPQAIKRRQGIPPQGDECVGSAGVPAEPSSSGSQRCRGRRLRTAKKKEGSLIPPRTTHRPLTEGNELKMTEEIPTGRRHHDKTSLV